MEEQKNGSWRVSEAMEFFDVVVSSDNKVGEQYTIPEDGPFVLEDELEIYRMRKLQNQYLVKVLDLKRERSNSLCMGTECIKIITERIPYRLNEIQEITPYESIYILFCCLKGFKVICQMLGPVIVEQRMIGVDSNGDVKVWINQNFSRNYAQPTNKIAAVKDKAIQKMVLSILNTLSTLNLPEELVLKLKRILATSMEEHISTINKYIKEKKVDISKIKVKTKKQHTSFLEGEGKPNSKSNNSFMDVPDESSTSMIEGVPHPVAQLVHKVFKPKFFEYQKPVVRMEQQVIKMQNSPNNKNFLALPPIKVLPPSRYSPSQNNRPISPYPNGSNRPISPMPNMRVITPMANIRPISPMATNNMPRPISPMPQDQRMMAMNPHGLMPPSFLPSNLGNRGNSPRERSPQPVQQYFNQNQINNQNRRQAQNLKVRIPEINTRKDEIKHIKQQKRQKNLAESQCKPLNMMQQSECFPLQKPIGLNPHQYQRMMFQEMNHPFGPGFAKQMMDPNIFLPPGGYSNSNLNMNMMGNNIGYGPSHINPPMDAQQYIHSHMVSNLQQHFQPHFNSNLQGKGQQYIPLSNSPIFNNNLGI